MKSNTIKLIGSIVVMLGLLFFLMFDCGQKIERTRIHREAIEAGVAEFTANPMTGATEFRWIPPVLPAQAPTGDPLRKVEKIEPERIEQ